MMGDQQFKPQVIGLGLDPVPSAIGGHLKETRLGKARAPFDLAG